MKPRFKLLSGDQNWSRYGGKWISQRFNNGEFDFWFVLELINLYDACGEREAKEMGGQYAVECSVVSPSEAANELPKAASSWGIELDDIKTDEQRVELLHSYGTKALVCSIIGNNYSQLMQQAKRKAMESEFLFGFAMDQPQNAIGTTGWDMLRGDLLAPLNRLASNDEPANVQIMRKIQGAGQ
jgi:hypothetical protein